MARIAFHYIPGNSFLHRWDARCKFLGFLILTATLIQIKISLFLFQSILLVSLFFLSKSPIQSLARDLRFWLLFLFLLFLFHSLFTPGKTLSFSPYLPLTKEGLFGGGLVCWRLGLILGYATLFTSVTRPRELRETIAWILKPIPLFTSVTRPRELRETIAWILKPIPSIPNRRIGLMVSMMWRFFYRFLDHKEEVELAYQARLGNLNRNPFRKIKSLVLPLLRKALFEVEEVTYALASRGYHDRVPLFLPKLPLSHWIPILALSLALIPLLLF